ncbi:MAG: alginate export family protein [Planctomycetes bacterium]|nr:alginate export family protein [Planctomycetota bacterium]
MAVAGRPHRRARGALGWLRLRRDDARQPGRVPAVPGDHARRPARRQPGSLLGRGEDRPGARPRRVAGAPLRTWDGVSARYDAGPWSVTGFATWFVPVQKRSFNDSDDDQEFYGVYATRAPQADGRGYDVYVLGNSRPNVTVNGTTGDERRYTVGGRTWGALGAFAGGKVDGEVEGAWQFGEVGNADVSAWSIAAVLGYRPDDWRWSPRFFCGVDAASGDERQGGDVETFHQLFPLGHAYLGWADAVGRQNVFAVQAGAQLALTPSTSLQVVGHSFRLIERSDALYNVGGGVARTGLGGREVGHEVDVLVNHKIDRHVSLYGGYSHLFAGDGIAASGPSEDQRFLYLGASVVF